MDDLWIYRSLIFAVIEYGLMVLILWKGKTYRLAFAATLFLLASYQLGEFIFLSSGEVFGLQFAIFSTTLLPPIGIYIMHYRMSHYYLYWITQSISLCFAFLFLIKPDIFVATQQCFCLVKYASGIGTVGLITVWGVFYLATLMLAMAMAVRNYFDEVKLSYKKFNFLFLLAYTSFFPTSYFITLLVPDFSLGDVTSVMCAMALLAAFILTWVSVKLELK